MGESGIVAYRWYCAEAEPYRMEQGRISLLQSNFNLCHPTYIITRVVRGVRQEFEYPLFPGYFLIEFDVEVEGWQNINRTRGIRRLMCGASELPLPLPSKVMDELIRRVAEGPIRDVHDLMFKLIKAGQWVKVSSGPMMGTIGKVKWSERNRVWVLLNFFGSERAVEFQSDALELLNTNRSS